MPPHPVNYDSYLSTPAPLFEWGIVLSAAGCAHTAPGQAYPPTPHPQGHHFSWERGRILDGLQIVLVTGGTGELEIRHYGTFELTAGSAFLLLPQVWHRYRPNPHTGWNESWIEIRGPLVNHLLQTGSLSHDRVVRHRVLAGRLGQVLDAIHQRTRSLQRSTPELSALAMQALAAWADRPSTQASSRVADAIEQAEQILTDRHAEDLNMPELAQQLGLAYSHMRREFKKLTGYSPWQYVLHVRLSRVCRLLLSSDLTLDQIAGEVGFSSAFHLSTQFKKVYGSSPLHWKRNITRTVK
ncbi:MAG: AraC family transcriptional regulator [Verrucomicrobiota bacterium JB022]|nr:AraC family transcriptional regulator [Verrucomicrobiota bacterium JB022]